MTIEPRAVTRPARLRFGAFQLAIAIVGLIVLLATLAPLLPIASYTQMSSARLAPPSLTHWLGTDEFGRDLFSRVVHGLRISLTVGLSGVFASTVAGVALGICAGYFGGSFDAIVMRLLDAALAFPSLLLAIGVAAVMGPGAVGTAIALGIVGTPQMARLVRAGAMAERTLQYVEAARSSGSGALDIIGRHILPNVSQVIAIQFVLFFVIAVLTESSLSFLGLGVQVPTPSLGSMLNTSRTFMAAAPWYALAPGAALTITVLCLNAIADGLRGRMERAS